MSISFKKILPHLIVVALFVIAALAYFSPVLQGKTIFQSDIVQYQGMAKELKDYRKETGQETYWTDAAFGGMPTYQLGAKYPYNFVKKLDLTLRFLPRPADYLFLYFIGMYILLLVLKLDYRLAFLGALAFGFSTYLIIILGVGHNAKAHAIAYMPLVLSGIILTFRGKYLYGFLLLTVAMALELVANHFQMTYYLLFLVVCIGAAYLIDAFRKKMLPHYFKALGVMAMAVLLAVGLNSTNILATKEYADTSTRGKTELTINPDGTKKESAEGLDYDYITTYSYGKLESFNLFIPKFMGGGSADFLPENSETEEALMRMGASPQDVSQILNQLPVYWGDQPIVAAPAYVGAIVIFLAIMALFLVRGRLKWWVLGAFFLCLFLSWGRNFEFLTEFFIEYVPLYNKFRAVSSIQVIIELILPVLAVVGLHQFFNDFVKKEEKVNALKWSAIIVGGITLIFIVLGGQLFDFASPYDAQVREGLSNQIVESLRVDRASLMQADAIRSLIFVILTGGVLWLFIRGKIKDTWTIAILALLVVIDLVGIDTQYVNGDDFVNTRVMEQPFQKSGADIQILEDEGHYRVYDATNDAFNYGGTSYYHNAIGGYHAAKPQRMQDLGEFYIERGNVGILNMLNVKYIITKNKDGGPIAQRNPYNNGNVWLVESAFVAETADEEILLLDSLNTRRTAVIHRDFADRIPSKNIERDSTATIELVNYSPQHLTYESSTQTPQLAIFSEMYYPHGWNVYVNDKPAEYFRANYALRAMTVPAGNNKIEFKFEPEVIQKGSTITLMSSILFLLLLVGGLWWNFRRKNTNETTS